MQKVFYPDIEYNRKKRSKLLVLYVLLALFPGGFAVFLLTTGQTMMAMIMFAMLVLLLTMVPSTLQQYPTKRLPLITIEGKNVTFGKNDVVKSSDIVSVSVVIEVPAVSKIKAENEEFLNKVASQKPTEQLLGTCDVAVLNAKNKEVVKYAIVEDCIGALEGLLALGVKKYRILYTMKKMTVEAQYSLGKIKIEGESSEELSERDKIMQLL